MKFTENASKMVKEVALEYDIMQVPVVRIVVYGAGCSGMTYDMTFIEGKYVADELEEFTELEGFSVVVDPISSQYLEGVTVDYIVTEHGAGFVFDAPNYVKSKCEGCTNTGC